MEAGGNEVRGHIEARELNSLESYSELSLSQNIKIRLLLSWSLASNPRAISAKQPVVLGIELFMQNMQKKCPKLVLLLSVHLPPQYYMSKGYEFFRESNLYEENKQFCEKSASFLHLPQRHRPVTPSQPRKTAYKSKLSWNWKGTATGKIRDGWQLAGGAWPDRGEGDMLETDWGSEMSK